MHMTSVWQCNNVMNNVMTTSNITLSAGTSDVMPTSVTKMRIFIELTNVEVAFERSYDKQNLTLVIILY